MEKLDATRQALGRLPQQFLRGASEQEESGRRSRTVGQHAEQGKEIRPSLDLVQNNEALKAPQYERRLIETSQIRRVLEVEAGRGTFRPFAGNLFRQRRFPHLPRTKDGNDRVPGEQRHHLAPGGFSFDHLRHAGMLP
jgi:hypothetical protein